MSLINSMLQTTKHLIGLTLCAFAVIAVNRAVADDAADQVYDRIVENWRWSQYWFGTTGIGENYVEGKRISAFIFWNKNESQPIRGLCSAELSVCVAYSGVYLDPAPRRMAISPDTTAQQAFTSFVNSGFRDSSHLLAVTGLSQTNFQVEQKTIALPALEPPPHSVVPEGASQEAERIRRHSSCWGVGETRPLGCKGYLVFAYYGEDDPYWFVLTSCSEMCESKGDSVEMLRRGDHGWEATSGGVVANKAQMQHLKQQIEKAEMFRLQF